MSYSFPPSVTPQESREAGPPRPSVLLDVREHGRVGHRPPSECAAHPMGEIPTRLNELKSTSGFEIVVLCIWDAAACNGPYLIAKGSQC